MRDFIYAPLIQRIVFGTASLARLPEEIERLRARRALVLCTPQQRDQAERVATLLGTAFAGIFDGAVMHVPIEAARAARAMADQLDADCAVAIGGGSTMGLAKAIALDSGLPIIAVPTTYAGSEVTSIYGLTEAGLKRTGKDPRVLPKTVLYDPELSYGLPLDMSIASGINAIAHAAEGLYSIDGNPVIDLMAQEGIAALGQALRALRGEAGAAGAAMQAARSQALYGAWLCGTVLGNVGMAMHHKLCHTLGGSFNLPHAETHTVVLPHVLAYNAPAAPLAMERIARALGRPGESAACAVFDLAASCGAPTALSVLGMKQEDLDQAGALAMQNPYANPRPLEAKAVRALLQQAFDGVRPTA